MVFQKKKKAEHVLLKQTLWVEVIFFVILAE
jgi:hypothetical protein